MAQVRSLIQDQNFNVHFDGASAGGKAHHVLKAPRKGAVSGRKPLSDLSNSVKPTPNQSLKKQQTGGRKALTDISNKSKQQVQEAPKKDVKTKVSIVEEEEHLKSIAEEGFLHNHEECIKARTRAMDTDEFLKIVGLGSNNGFSRMLASSPPWKPTSPPKFMELEEMPLHYLEDRHDTFSDLDSPPLSPKSMSPLWMGNADVNFMLIDSP